MLSDSTASDRGLYSVECCLASDCVCGALGLLPVRLCVCVGGCGLLSDSTGAWPACAGYSGIRPRTCDASAAEHHVNVQPQQEGICQRDSGEFLSGHWNRDYSHFRPSLSSASIIPAFSALTLLVGRQEGHPVCGGVLAWLSVWSRLAYATHCLLPQ